VPIHAGGGHTLGQGGGEQAHTLSIAEVPPHTHVMYGSDTPAETNVPTGAFLAQVNNGYKSSGSLVALSSAAVSNVGGEAHENRQPFLTLSFCIALQGFYPPRN
jgi:microcystin-dependent protein